MTGTWAILLGQLRACESFTWSKPRRMDMQEHGKRRDVFLRISAHPVNRLSELLPDNWKAAQNTIPNLPA